MCQKQRCVFCRLFIRVYVWNTLITYTKLNPHMCPLSDQKDFWICHHISEKRCATLLLWTRGHTVDEHNLVPLEKREMSAQARVRQFAIHTSNERNLACRRPTVPPFPEFASWLHAQCFKPYAFLPLTLLHSAGYQSH